MAPAGVAVEVVQAAHDTYAPPDDINHLLHIIKRQEIFQDRQHILFVIRQSTFDFRKQIDDMVADHRAGDPLEVLEEQHHFLNDQDIAGS